VAASSASDSLLDALPVERRPSWALSATRSNAGS
jgi:hypothetical protein